MWGYREVKKVQWNYKSSLNFKHVLWKHVSKQICQQLDLTSKKYGRNIWLDKWPKELNSIRKRVIKARGKEYYLIDGSINIEYSEGDMRWLPKDAMLCVWGEKVGFFDGNE